MATLAERLQAEIDRSNATTGKADATVHEAVGSLIEGYGKVDSCVEFSDYGDDGKPRSALVKGITNTTYLFANEFTNELTSITFADNCTVKVLGSSTFGQLGLTPKVSIIIIPQGVTTVQINPFFAIGGESLDIYLPRSIQSMPSSLSYSSKAKIKNIYVPWSEGEVANAPWGAVNATIHYNYTGGDIK